MKSMTNYFLFLVFSISFILLFSSCSSVDNVVNKIDKVNISTPNLSSVVDSTSESQVTPVVVDKFEKLVKLGEDTSVVYGDKSAIVKITGANTGDDSVIISVKQGTGENVKKVYENQIISFGTLRVCVNEIVIEEKSGYAQMVFVPTFSQKVVAWFSMVAPKDDNLTCDVFKKAVELSEEKDGAVKFFAEQFKVVSDNDFVTHAYSKLLGGQLDSFNLQAWNFYVKENGRDAFLRVIVDSQEFKDHESSIK